MTTFGLSGHLLSASFLEARLMPASVDSRAVVRSRRLGPASALRAVLDAGAAPMLLDLGLGTPQFVETSPQRLIATVSCRDDPITLLVTFWGEPLHLHWRAAVEHATLRDSRWCLLFNGAALRVVDAAHPHSSRYAEFDLEAAAEDGVAAAAVRFVAGQLGGALAVLVHDSDQHGVAVCRALRDGVLSASSDVLAAFVRTRRHPDDASLRPALDQALTVVYRVLFLLFAESRGLVPSWHPIYRDSYSIGTLVAAATRGGDPHGLWDALRAIARLAHAGCRAGDLRVTPFNGRLFSPSRTPLAERRDLDDERARQALIALATRPSIGGAGRERIAYRDLGVEQLGSVYESLLDYRPQADPVALVPGSGIRKATGTFYTPQAIADYLVRRTLGPLVAGAEPPQILALRLVDPSMGSGAFLVAACRFLAHAYEAALIRNGGVHPTDISEADRAVMRRTIAERCLYGVDINPMAVQLARLSLWLTTLSADRPLTFLDHRLQVGDSILGAWLDDLRHAPLDARRRSPRRPESRDLFDGAVIQPAIRAALPVRFSLELTPDDTLEQVRAKEQALASLTRRDTALSMWKRIAGVWCASWLAADRHSVPPEAFSALVDHVLSEAGSLPSHVAARYLVRADELALERNLFHWELEFPEVFFDTAGQRRAGAGFDAVIGNPPWEVVRGDEAALRFTRRSGVYSSAAGGHGNLYQLFTERAVTLLKTGGRLGLVLPSGVATDHACAPLRRHLLRDCAVDTLVGLDNHRGVFAIHRGVKFLLATATKGTPTTSIDCRFGESDPSSLDTADSGEWFRVRVTREFIQRVSGEALTIPELRTRTDVTIVERAASLFPPLGSGAGWNISFGRELNATDDRAHFGPAGLPIVQGKHLDPFRARMDMSTHFIRAATARRLLADCPFERPRLAYRDVAGATNRLTLIAAMLPAGCVSTHTVFCLRTRLPRAAQHFLCGLFNSLVVNYLVRMRVTTHVTTATVERLPLPPPGRSPSDERRIAALARLLSRREDLAAWAVLQAHVAGLYQLTPAEFAHVLETFPLVPREERDAAYHAYETQKFLR